MRTTIKSLLRYWFTAVGWALGLTDYLLPRPEDNGGHDNGNGDVVRQERPHAQYIGQDRAIVDMDLDLDRVNRFRHVAANAHLAEDVDSDEHADTE